MIVQIKHYVDKENKLGLLINQLCINLELHPFLYFSLLAFRKLTYVNCKNFNKNKFQFCHHDPGKNVAIIRT